MKILGIKFLVLCQSNCCQLASRPENIPLTSITIAPMTFNKHIHCILYVKDFVSLKRFTASYYHHQTTKLPLLYCTALPRQNFNAETLFSTAEHFIILQDGILIEEICTSQKKHYLDDFVFQYLKQIIQCMHVEQIILCICHLFYSRTVHQVMGLSCLSLYTLSHFEVQALYYYSKLFHFARVGGAWRLKNIITVFWFLLMSSCLWWCFLIV